MADASKVAKVYINGRLIGFHSDPKELTETVINARRDNKLPIQTNVSYHKDTNEVYLNTDAGRVQRPLIVLKNGKSTYTEDLKKQVKEGKLSFNQLVERGVIEYLDPEEEENMLIAQSEEGITKEHTHMEIDGAVTLSIISSLIPYANHNMSGKALHGAKMFKQAIGMGAVNYKIRHDTEGYLLYYPEKNLVKTRTMDLIELDKRPQSQNFVMAIMPYYGFNTMDAIVLNRGAIERGLARASYFRNYETVEQRYPGGQRDKFEVPTEEKVGFVQEENYKKLGPDGIIQLEQFVGEEEAIIGKTSPPRFFEDMTDFGVDEEKRRDASLTIRKGKPGFVDTIMMTEGEDGSRLVKVKIRTPLIPQVGDKIASRHGQKGVVAAIVNEEDMPFTIDGIKPDLIINPHSIPSRMTMGHLMEMLGGKAGAVSGKIIDGTPFGSTPRNELEGMLRENGFRGDGMEVFYDGVTGKRIEGEIFQGIIATQKLFHVVTHKLQARARGPVQVLTRQPTEGKEKEGGLRFGEMEGETLVGHGAAMLLHEKLIEDSDKTVELVCEKCGVIAVNDEIRHKKYCPLCKTTAVYPVEMSYGFKLLLDELKALGILAKINLVDKV
ncbi:MAG: DNA-directed RNA polymerase subunit B [Candidatus ainarchaeum sp.]|jgi:DNA-directed RNA polymerase subunit B'|nr:DNA-directed RNA polymerase subunit B [Candidatus ainarchaeum sp.]MDD3085955.1 DNA-directed RNA polymerase subunit B [Candidatus ainarchaeum sp.]MDD4128311.1 DNA-directed RNA polymerase subunit B [Candidatus ainarchaeum sp.]MDD4467741.1 DNA-directed RNA polymerase subunit B [Candidatus ainarchaeum sp.]